jgi:hypothetical protein
LSFSRAHLNDAAVPLRLQPLIENSIVHEIARSGTFHVAAAVTISHLTLAEGNAGTTAFVSTVNLAPGSGQTVTADHRVQDWAATTPLPVHVDPRPGRHQRVDHHARDGDMAIEPNETFNVMLSNAPLAMIDAAPRSRHRLDRRGRAVAIRCAGHHRAGGIAGKSTATQDVKCASAGGVLRICSPRSTPPRPWAATPRQAVRGAGGP